jgi:ParB-like chromosome segregation protein Spo0J
MLTENQNLNVVYVPIAELLPATYNPRKWNEESIAQLTESIKRFGLVDPIVVNGARD